MNDAAPLQWQRTPLLTLGFFIGKEIRHLIRNITNFIPVLAAIFVTDSLWLPYAIGGGYLVYVIISAILNHRFFLFALTDDAVHLRTGVLGKKSLTLKYERIQQAELDQTWYFRPFGLTILRVDSAGSAGKEVEIPGLSLHLGQQLRQQMLERTASPSIAADSQQANAQPPADAQTDYEHQFPLSEIIRAGIIDNKLFVLLAVLIYPVSQTKVLEEQVIPWLEANISFLEDSLWLNVGLVLVVLGILFVLAIAVTVVNYYNLHLAIADNRYQTRSGLFSIRTVSFRYHKLQRIRIKQNLRARLLRRFSVRVSQLQPSAHAQRQNSNAFVLPILTSTTLTEFSHWLRLPNRDQIVWQKVSALALLSSAFWIALTAPIAAVIGYFQTEQLFPSLFIGAMLWLALQSYAVARWQNYGYCLTEDWLTVKRGVFGRTESWYPLFKTQQIDVYQSPWLRLLGYADVIMHTAAGAEVIKYQPVATAFAMQRQWTNRVAESKRRWM